MNKSKKIETCTKGRLPLMLTVENISNDPFYNQAFGEHVYQAYLDDDIFFF